MDGKGAGRYAPSPSGDLHLGNLRTAMLAWLFARSTGRAFLMRIEDTDHGRNAGVASRQLADLRALGIDWDDRPVVQSEREHLYRAAIAQLSERGLVYECVCTRREILDAPRAPHSPPGAYPGTCRNLSDLERSRARARIAPRLPALRLRTPAHMRESSFNDLLLGRIVGAIDDLVLQRGDGAIAYNVAVVIDDAEMRVDQIVRGDDLAATTPRQNVLQALLDLPGPSRIEYAHVPLVLGPSGARLAKRDGAVTLRQLAESGTSVDAVRTLLAASLNLAEAGESVSMTQLISRFDPNILPRHPWKWRPGEPTS